MADFIDKILIEGLLGRCGGRQVFLGFAAAKVLHGLSFADVLDEARRTGYQRRFNDRHSLDFRKYIQTPNSTTIPLTFNLRNSAKAYWDIRSEKNGRALLTIVGDTQTKVFAQVDCQHRLGYLEDSDVPLAFMTFIGLNVTEEMEVFYTINSKAKGLSSSLTDFHEAQLANDLSKEKPELLIALYLNEQKDSPWRGQLDLGGDRTSGLKRRASLRTMQKGVKRFIADSKILEKKSATEAASTVLEFWKAVASVLQAQWLVPRKHFLNKGVGVYSLMSIAADLYQDSIRLKVACDQMFFTEALSAFAINFDWTNQGPLKGLGGEAGANKAYGLLRNLRNKSQLRMVNRGR